MEATKHIGLLGLGSRSTEYYFNALNTHYQSIHGDYHTCPIKLLNANFNDINPYLPDQFERLEPITISYLNQLVALGVESILIPNITLHQTLDRVWPDLQIDVPLIHPVHLAAKEMVKNGAKTVCILGSKYTMVSNYIPAILLSYGIETTSPSSPHIDFIDQCRKALYSGIETKENILELEKIIAFYAKTSSIIIACTELSTLHLHNPDNNVFDLARLQVHQAIRELQA